MSPEPTPPIEILTEQECAARLSVTRECLSRWRRDKHLPFVAIGDGPKPRIRYVWDDVAAWLRAQGRNVPNVIVPRRRGRPRNIDREGGPW